MESSINLVGKKVIKIKSLVGSEVFEKKQNKGY